MQWEKKEGKFLKLQKSVKQNTNIKWRRSTQPKLTIMWQKFSRRNWRDKFKMKSRVTKLFFFFQFSSVQSLSRVRLFATPWITAHQASLSITNSRSSLRLMSIESVMPSSHLILCHPLLLLRPIPPSIRVLGYINFNRNCLKIQNNKTLDIHAASTFKIMMICLLLTQPNCRNKTMQIVLWNGKYKPISNRPGVNTTSKILKSSQGLERLNLITRKMATYVNKDFGAEENLIGHGSLGEDVS